MEGCGGFGSSSIGDGGIRVLDARDEELASDEYPVSDGQSKGGEVNGAIGGLTLRCMSAPF